MQVNQPHYLPLTLPFFALLVGVFVFLLAMLQVGALRYAYMRIGLSGGWAMVVLLGSLVGSYFNIPVTELPEQHIVSGEAVNFFGMRYVIPVVVDWPGTVVAVNVGGGLIPGLMSLYLFVRYRLWVRGLLAVACVAVLCNQLAHPIRGLGIAMPVFVPAVASAIVHCYCRRGGRPR